MPATRKAPAAPATATNSADWNPLWEAVRALDPAFLDAYLALRAVPMKRGPLPPKTREFILIALNAATTHLYAPGVRRHMQNALRLGATRAELMQVIELTMLLGIHGCNLAVPILVDECERHAAGATAKPRPRAKATRRTASATPARRR